MADKFYVYRPMLDLLGFTEGTDKGRGYNETLAYGKFTGGDRNLVGMTMSQIDALQTQMLAHPKNTFDSSALGRYQIVRTTRREIQEQLNIPDSAKFDKDMQDRMACYLLGYRGIDKWLEGDMSTDMLVNNLAKEWASLPTTKDKSYYGGQHAAVNALHVVDVLAEVRKRWVSTDHPIEQPAPPKPVPAPKPDFGVGSSPEPAFGDPRPRKMPTAFQRISKLLRAWFR